MANNKVQKLLNVTEVSDHYTITKNDDIVYCTASLKTMTLPLLGSVPKGKAYYIYAYGPSSVETSAGVETMRQGSAVYNSLDLNKIKLVSNGSYWIIL